MERRKTRQVMVGNVGVGGESSISIQSMLNTKNGDFEVAEKQTKALALAGCDIVRLAVTDDASIEVVKRLKQSVDVPLVADIQFDYRLALRAIEAGIDKIRINPGNIGSDDKVRAVADAAGEKNIPIRIGVNTGSISQHIIDRFGGRSAQGLVEEAMRHVRILEENQFRDIIISLKASSVPMMIESYRMIADMVDYPLHLGVTEAGTAYSGTVKSAVGIGTLLSEGIGDTIRVSLTADPVEEITAAKEILSALELRRFGATMVSCPTCARCRVDLISIANEVSRRLKDLKREIKVAVMGCVVNGPGEARDADIGITGANGEGLVFRGGKVIRRVPEAEIVDVLFEEIDKI
ncbi:MAG: flavodoxin-dependent (E)-4-hydroxy-3-methylbut-2-enyl-diphosphate synthase [Clostridia bacterium]|nr:flavodoxin-dependent (E)-4-hydroxy-3-methylbut-2-enyl-diphosphate synthase [Clostridia bacterium]